MGSILKLIMAVTRTREESSETFFRTISKKGEVLKMKNFRILFVLAVTAVMLSQGSVFADNPGSMEVSVTPLVTYSIQITTPAGGIDFGAKDMDTAYVNETSATVKNNGNITADWKVKATALNVWTMGTTLADNGSDKAVLAALFNTALPAVGTYVDADVLLTSEKNADATSFTGDQNGDNVAKNAEKLIWIYIKTPTDTSVDTTQKFRIDIKAYPSSTF